ncbi:hypothetical protein [Leptotrichia trevisanii]|uniref:hypothetical protein n=1 Tax=Leptotrichia trevisanii TaxID=109328 RepID=UPI0026F1D754|nr:hypothetical protein [Leptotrichia trevisanii]
MPSNKVRFVPEKNELTESFEDKLKEMKEKIKDKEKYLGNKVKMLDDRKEREKLFKNLKEDLDKINDDINIAQFMRFYKLVEKQDFSIKEEKDGKKSAIKKFLKDQKERDIALKFYNYIEKEFIEKVENEDKKLNKTKLTLIEQYLKYKEGRERIEENK